MVMLGSLDSALPPKGERRVSLRKPPRQLSLGQDPLPASPLISTRNLVPGLSYGVVKLDRLGKGATSDVWRGIHVASLKVLALKEIVVSTDADRRAVRTEMRALRTQRSPLLNSTFTTELKSCPRIVDFYGSVVRENGNACIAVEYIAGGSLGSWLESGYKCPEPWIAHIAQQTLEALDFLHTGGRVHRDVKPANILITRKGDVKLGDFGAAGVENSSRMVGTQRFMAPERLKGHRASPQSDLWSLGLSLATAAVGDDFISQASNEFEQLDLAGGARSMLAKTTTISPELRDFLHSCLSRDPARRPALQELMKHPFLNQRHDWAKKCPEVMVAMRENKRRQRESSGALSTKAVLDILCEARAEDNLVDSPPDTATADDLAYELGVTAESLVRSVHRGTLELIRERSGRGSMRLVGGDTRGVGGLRSEPEGNTRRQDRFLGGVPNEEVVSVSQAETSFSNLGESSRNLYLDSEGSYSSIDSLPSMVAAFGGEESGKVAPLATVGDTDKVTSGDCVNRMSNGIQGEGKPAGNFVAVMDSSGTRKRVVEISPAVKLTPHKRRGEKRSLQIKRYGPGGGDTVGSKSEQVDNPEVARHGVNLKIDACSNGKNGKPSATTEEKTSGGEVDAVCSTPRAEEGGAVTGCSSSWRREVEKQHRLLETRKRSVRSVFQVADEMKAHMVVRDRVYRLRVYPDCFSGREAVQWMLDRCHASSVVEAEKLGNEMMKASVFQHILNSQIFEDSSAYYQFTDGVTPPPPAKGGRRIRQVARVWGGHVARKFVHHGGGTSSGSNGSGVTRVVERTNGATSRSASSRSPAAQARGSNGRGGVVDGVPTVHPTVCSFRQPVEMGIKSLPKFPKSISGDLKKHRRSRRHSAGKCQSQQRRFSSSVSSVLTAPETPY